MLNLIANGSHFAGADCCSRQSRPLLFAVGLVEITLLAVGILGLTIGMTELTAAITMTAVGGVLVIIDVAVTWDQRKQIRVMLHNRESAQDFSRQVAEREKIAQAEEAAQMEKDEKALIANGFVLVESKGQYSISINGEKSIPVLVSVPDWKTVNNNDFCFYFEEKNDYRLTNISLMKKIDNTTHGYSHFLSKSLLSPPDAIYTETIAGIKSGALKQF